MISKKSWIKRCRLYVILDGSAVGSKDPREVAAAAMAGGADALQWRDKEASDRDFLAMALELRELTRRSGTLFVVNDRVAVAQIVQADAVHVGHEDIPVRDVRRLVGKNLLIGRSTHSMGEALQAELEGADYIGLGPVFQTPTKPGYPAVGLNLVRQAAVKISVPWFAIGGIDLAKLPLVLSAGAQRVAVVRSVVSSSDPMQAARALKEQLTSMTSFSVA